jgi:hypothetical protein
MVGQCAGNGGSKSRYSLIQLASETVILHCETDGHERVGKYVKCLFGNRFYSGILLRSSDTMWYATGISFLASFLRNWHAA